MVLEALHGRSLQVYQSASIKQVRPPSEAPTHLAALVYAHTLQRVQDQILQWVREGRWDRVVQEKRNVLVCMQQVLQSCHTLLDSTQIPVDGVVRLLQHILRCACCVWCGK